MGMAAAPGASQRRGRERSIAPSFLGKLQAIGRDRQHVGLATDIDFALQNFIELCCHRTLSTQDDFCCVPASDGRRHAGFASYAHPQCATAPTSKLMSPTPDPRVFRQFKLKPLISIDLRIVEPRPGTPQWSVRGPVAATHQAQLPCPHVAAVLKMR